MGTLQRNLSLALAAALAPASWLVACGGDDLPPPLLDDPDAQYQPRVDVLTSPDVVKDSYVPPDASLGCYGADGGCNSLTVCGPKVNIVTALGMPPMPTGGAVVDGTYVLTDVTGYVSSDAGLGPTNEWLRETFAIAGPKGQLANESSSSTGTVTTSNVTLGFPADAGDAGPTMTLAYTCGGGAAVGQYTATAGQLVVVFPESSGPAQFTYTKQ